MSERYIQYIGESDVAKVEEHPFNEEQVTCMILTEGHLKGRNISPPLIECADSVEGDSE